MHVQGRSAIAVRTQGRGVALMLALFFGLACQSISAQVNQQSSDLVVTEAEQTMFTKGQTLYNQGLYGEAIIILNDFLTVYPSSTIKDLSLLWLGRSYLGQGDIANAEKIELRLKDIPDTALVSLYEDELRIARQNYAKTAAPKPSGKKPVVPVSTGSGSDRVPTKGVGHNTDPVATAPGTDKSTALSQPLPRVSQPTATVTTNPPAQVSTGSPSDRVSTKTVSHSEPTASGTDKSIAAKPSSRVIAPILRSRFEEATRKGTNGLVSYRLLMTNEGNAPANDLTIRLELDPSLTYVSSDLLPLREELIGQRQILTFRLPAVEAGQTNAIQLSLRPRAAASAKTTAQTKHSIFYKDSQGQFHHTP